MMLDVQLPAATDMELYTDASGSHDFGTYYSGAWFSVVTGSHTRRLNRGSL